MSPVQPALTSSSVATHGERITDAARVTVPSHPPVIAQLGGTTQDLPGGRLLASFGSGARVEEYDAAGNVVWRIEQPGYVFRAQHIASLYRPGEGSPR